MRIFIVFAPKFLQWPLAVLRRIEEEVPGSRFAGLVTGERSIFDAVSENEIPQIEPLHWLNDLEEEWLSRPLDDERLAEIESILGTEALSRAVIADRQLGQGYVSGATTITTVITKLARDPDNIRRYVVGQIDYILCQLKKFQADLVFCYGVAGSFAVSLAEVCQYYGIKFVRLTPARVDDLQIVDDSPNGFLEPIGKAFKLALSKKTPWPDVSRGEHYLAAFRKQPTAPEYAATNRSLHFSKMSMRGFLRTALAAASQIVRHDLLAFRQKRELRRSSATDRAHFDLSTVVRARHFVAQPDSKQPNEWPSRRFAFFPLQVDPEASTMVLAPNHTNQFSVVEALSKSMPFAMDLVVKEHVPMLGRRPYDFYNRLERIPRVYLASPFVDSFELIRRAELTCVISGTAGFQAILLGKPVLVVGNAPWLTIGDGFVHETNLSKLTEAVTQALELKPVSDRLLSLYISLLFQFGFSFPRELLWGTVTAETVANHPRIVRHIADGILRIHKGARFEDAIENAFSR